MKTGILIHGHHLGTNNWEEVVWGNPKEGVYGRIPAGVREAIRFNASVIFFPTGGSEKDGLKEGEWALKIARERLKEIPECAVWGDDVAQSWLSERALVELTSQTTAEEIVACARIAVQNNIERLVLVSSPTHIIRALQTVLSVCTHDSTLRPLLHGLCAVPSDISYEGATIDDVVVIEPPHRPDRPAIPFHQVLKRIFEFNNDEAPALELYTKLTKVFDEFKKNT